MQWKQLKHFNISIYKFKNVLLKNELKSYFQRNSLLFVLIRKGKRSPCLSILRVLLKTSQQWIILLLKYEKGLTCVNYKGILFKDTSYFTKITPSVAEHRVSPFTQNGNTLDTLDCKHIYTNINAFSSWNSGFSCQICSMICYLLPQCFIVQILSTVFKLQLKTTYKQHFRI